MDTVDLNSSPHASTAMFLLIEIFPQYILISGKVGARIMIQWIKAISSQPDGMSSIPGTHIRMEEEK